MLILILTKTNKKLRKLYIFVTFFLFRIAVKLGHRIKRGQNLSQLVSLRVYRIIFRKCLFFKKKAVFTSNVKRKYKEKSKFSRFNFTQNIKMMSEDVGTSCFAVQRDSLFLSWSHKWLFYVAISINLFHMLVIYNFVGCKSKSVLFETGLNFRGNVLFWDDLQHFSKNKNKQKWP